MRSSNNNDNIEKKTKGSPIVRTNNNDNDVNSITVATTTTENTDGFMTNPLMEEVIGERNRRTTGVVAGGAFLIAGCSIGFVSGILHSPRPEILTPIGISAAFGISIWIKLQEEKNDPLIDEDSTTTSPLLVVEESQIPNAGQGLYTTIPISKGTYIFYYKGERLTESEYFHRYPDGQGRYVAELPSPYPWSYEQPIYVDGIDTNKSGLARYMNSLPSGNVGCNVIGKKKSRIFFINNDEQKSASNLYFYAARDILEGEELCFDYGSTYWDAVRE